MSLTSPLRLLLLLAAISPLFAAQQVEPRTFYSPIVNKPFQAATIPIRGDRSRALGDEGGPDMGTDIDGCRHSSGLSEYDYFIITDPHTYFSALASEWGPNGRFIQPLDDDFRRWLTSRHGFNDEWVTDRDRLYSREARRARAQGRSFPDRQDWVIPQDSIPIERRYRYALMCYSRRNFPAAFQGRVALMGAWAVRVRCNLPIIHSNLRGGIEEVNSHLQRHIIEGERFDLDKWTDVYRRIFARRRLTDEAYFVAGSMLLGLELRHGDLHKVRDVMAAMERRFDDNEKHFTLRGLMRSRRNLIEQDYIGFLDIAAQQLTQALAEEAIARPRMLEILFTIAECHRRAGRLNQAYEWYLALTQLEETQPRIRAELRDAGKVPSIEAAMPLLIAWRAEDQMLSLRGQVDHDGTIAGRDRELLHAIVNRNLGTPEYENPNWSPRRNGDPTETQHMLDAIGRTLLSFHQSQEQWPRTLDDLWMRGAVPDRNVYNRFHCVVTGAPFAYNRPIGEQRGSTVLLTTSQPLSMPQGRRYGMFLADARIVWAEELTKPGEIYRSTGP